MFRKVSQIPHLLYVLCNPAVPPSHYAINDLLICLFHQTVTFLLLCEQASSDVGVFLCESSWDMILAYNQKLPADPTSVPVSVYVFIPSPSLSSDNEE